MTVSFKQQETDTNPPRQGFWHSLLAFFKVRSNSQSSEIRFPALEAILDYQFKDPGLLANALLHRSQVHIIGCSREDSNERLEFLGDAILGAVVSDYLYTLHPDSSEGDLTKMKSLLVCGARLAEIAVEWDFGRFVRMSRSEAAAGGRLRPTILADATEAMLGAIYLDGGYPSAEGVIKRLILADCDRVLNRQALRNYKSTLQELIQADHKSPPRYKIVSASGPDHDRRFAVIVTFEGVTLGQGEGTNKKAAEQEAAKNALIHLETKA